MPSSPPAAGTGQEEVEMVSGEASRPLHAEETGAGGDAEAPSSSEEEGDGEESDDDMDEDEEGSGSSDDSDMEDGEEEDEEEEDSDYSSDSSSLDSYEEQLAADLEEVDRVWEKMKKEAAAEGNGVQHANSAVASCCVCMEPWTSDGSHRICCIPCGHVYGRSCLEKWLHRCGGTMAKCPQCGESFEHKRIINLYATEYLWNDCIHDQELHRLVSLTFERVKEAARKSSKNKQRLRAMERKTYVVERRVVRMNEEMTEFRGEVASLMEKMNDMIISKGGDDTVTPTPDRMLKFLSQNWPKLPRAMSSTLDT